MVLLEFQIVIIEFKTRFIAPFFQVLPHMTQFHIELLNKSAINPNIPLYGSYDHITIYPLIIENNQGGAPEIRMFVNNGFLSATSHQNNSGFNYYYTFTDRWRKLKECGSYELLIEREQNEIEIEKNKEFNSSEFIRLSKENAEYQKTLNPLIERANKSTVITNILLIIIFSLTLVIYSG